MEESKKVVCCLGNQHLCHIAEAYLRYFSHGRVIVSYPHPNRAEVHPKILETMLEDGIDLREVAPQVSAVAKTPDFLLVLGGDGDSQLSQNGIPRIEHQISELENVSLTQQDASYLERIREEVKKVVLKFIGKEL